MVVFNATSGYRYHHSLEFLFVILKRQVNVYHHYNYEFDFRRSYLLSFQVLSFRRELRFSLSIKETPITAHNTVISDVTYP